MAAELNCKPLRGTVDMSDSDQKSYSRRDSYPVAPAQASVRRLRSLAPLPSTSQLLLQILSDPDLDMLRLAGIVEQTPALAARILGVANSAFFAHAKDVRDVPDAIIRVLGLHLVRDLSISFVLSQPFDLSDCPRFKPLRYWTAAMESAVLAQLIATRLPVADSPTPAEAYLGGLLNNLGLLALVHVEPDAMDAVFEGLEIEPAEDLNARERQILGLDHGVAGAELATVWRLPPLLAIAMGPPDVRAQTHPHRILLEILHLCTQIRRCTAEEADPAGEPAILNAWSELGVATEAMPKVLARWQERSRDIAELAAAFLGAKS